MHGKASSRPLQAVTTDGEMVFVKLVQSMSSPLSAAVEAVATRIAHAMGYPVLQPALAELSASVDLSALDAEQRDCVLKSCGEVLCYPYRSDAVQASPGQMAAYCRADELFYFDVVMTNVDRTSENCNAFISRGEIVFHDYESCLSLLPSGVPGGVDSVMRIAKELRRNPLWPRLACTEGLLRTVDGVDAVVHSADFVAALPEGWFPSAFTKQRMASAVCGIASCADTYLMLFELARAASPETHDQRLSRSWQNREAFRQKYRL